MKFFLMREVVTDENFDLINCHKLWAITQKVKFSNNVQNILIQRLSGRCRE